MPDVGTLPVHFGWVMGNREIDLQQLGIADLGRVEGDLNRFGVARSLRADGVVAGIGSRSAGIAGDDVGHSFHMLKDGFHAPETAAGKYGGLAPRSC